MVEETRNSLRTCIYTIHILWLPMAPLAKAVAGHESSVMPRAQCGTLFIRMSTSLCVQNHWQESIYSLASLACSQLRRIRTKCTGGEHGSNTHLASPLLILILFFLLSAMFSDVVVLYTWAGYWVSMNPASLRGDHCRLWVSPARRYCYSTLPCKLRSVQQTAWRVRCSLIVKRCDHE
jgi:hypothetical protein